MRLAEELPLPQLRAPYLFSRRHRAPSSSTPSAAAAGRRASTRLHDPAEVPGDADGPGGRDAAGHHHRVARDRSIVICCGSGGVGKTTTSAAIALAGRPPGPHAPASSPSTRPAAWPTRSGVDELSNTPTRIAGDWPGELHALMLDPKGTFDDLISRYSDSEEQARDIRVNRIYRNLTGTLSGTQEYMAMEKLHELVEEGGFDVVVVDTPPSRNALDFLDAPRRLTHFLENRIFQALMAPTRAGLRFMGVAAHALLRTISKVAGADIVSDAVAFFQAFEGMEEGFRDPGGPGAGAPRPAGHRLRAGRLAPARLGRRGRPLRRQAGRVPDVGDRADRQPGPAPVRHRRQVADLAPWAAPAGAGPRRGRAGRPGREPGRLHRWPRTARRPRYAGLVAQVDPAPVYRVPLLNTDVHDLEGLGDRRRPALRPGRGPDAPTASAPDPGPVAGSANLWRVRDHPRGQ